jgi:hypothetical protein
MRKLRIVTLRFGTRQQKMRLERSTNPKLTRRACTCEYGLQSCRRNSGVAKRPRDPLFNFRNNAQLAAQLAASISDVPLIGPNLRLDSVGTLIEEAEISMSSLFLKFNRGSAISHPKSLTLRFARC